MALFDRIDPAINLIIVLFIPILSATVFNLFIPSVRGWALDGLESARVFYLLNVLSRLPV